MSEFFAKTPEKSQKRKDFYSSSKELLSTKYSTNKSPDLWYYNSENSKKTSCYNSEFRQYPNVYPWVYCNKKPIFTEKNYQLKSMEIDYNGEVVDIIEESLEKVERNEMDVENLKEKLAYQPDFNVSSLFELISQGKNSISILEIEHFYKETLNLDISYGELKEFYTEFMSFEEFSRVLKPRNLKYLSFYDRKQNLINYQCFEKMYIIQTQEILRRLLMIMVEKDYENRRILERTRDIFEGLDNEKRRDFFQRIDKKTEERLQIFEVI